MYFVNSELIDGKMWDLVLVLVLIYFVLIGILCKILSS